MIVMTVMTLITCVLANIIEIAMKNHESGNALCVYIMILSAPNPKRGDAFKRRTRAPSSLSCCLLLLVAIRSIYIHGGRALETPNHTTTTTSMHACMHHACSTDERIK
jgi:hypothetical protein